RFARPVAPNLATTMRRDRMLTFGRLGWLLERRGEARQFNHDLIGMPRNNFGTRDSRTRARLARSGRQALLAAKHYDYRPSVWRALRWIQSNRGCRSPPAICPNPFSASVSLPACRSAPTRNHNSSALVGSAANAAA